jgi:TolB-like protein/DNA-binding winged helix-turn-helix (wHTH) protein
MKSGEIRPHHPRRVKNAAVTDTLYGFGEFELDPARRALTRGGEAVAITTKAFDALVYLVEHAGQTVPRTELAVALWPKVVVEDNNLSQTILALRRTLGESESGARYIVTLPRQGYRFVADVSTRERGMAPPATAPVSSRAKVGMTTRLVVGGVLALALAIALATLFWPKEPVVGTALRQKSIAVLPFRNLSPDPEDAYFADGIHEEVLTHLARIRNLDVIGRTSVMQYAETGRPVAEIATALRVATVLEGSVRYAANRVRVTVRLVSTDSGSELWTETYDAELGDVFGIQADIATRIASALQLQLGTPLENPIRAVPTRSVEAYALYLKALALYRSNGGIGVSLSGANRSAINALLDEALRFDPDFPDALGWKSHMDLDSLVFSSIEAPQWRTRSSQLLDQAARNATRALAGDPALGVAQTTLARLDIFRWRLDDAQISIERAMQSNPNDSVVLHYRALLHCLLEQYPDAIRIARRAIELDPLNPAPYSPLILSLVATGERAEAIRTARALTTVAPAAAIGYVVLARTLTTSGNAPEILEVLKVAEQFLEDLRNFRVDAALSYAAAGAPEDAARMLQAFTAGLKGGHVDPGLRAMTHLAAGRHELARAELETLISKRDAAMDPMPLLLIRQNAWSDPVLETPEWLRLRRQLAYRSP